MPIEGQRIQVMQYVRDSAGIDNASQCDQLIRIRIEVACSRPDHLPTLSVAKTSKLSLLVKHHILAIDEAS